MTRLLDTPRSASPYLSVVVPAYRSELCLQALAEAIDRATADQPWDVELVLVNDFSPDGTWRVIEALCRQHPRIVGVDLRRNFGQDCAILTGMRHARGQYVAIMDDDLQHDPSYLPALLAEAEAGNHDVVYANFERKHQKVWKNLGSWFNGKVAEWVLDKPPGVYLSPYKVLRRDVAQMVASNLGPEPYVDGLIFQVTSRISQIPAEHHKRHAGSSSFTFWKSVNVWARLAFTFSARPLRLATASGFAMAIAGAVLAVVVVLYRLLFPENFGPYATGWASLMVAMLLVSGTQLLFFGIFGEYLGRTYLRVNEKPQTSIRTALNAAADDASAPTS